MLLPRNLLITALMIAAGLGAVLFLLSPGASRRQSRDRKPPVVLSLALGQAAAAAHCQSCHRLPTPDILDRTRWEEEVLPQMRYFVGLRKPETNSFRDLDLLLAAGVFPRSPTMTEGEWRQVAYYYLSAAPASLTVEPSQVRTGLTQFEAVPARFRRDPPRTTLARIVPELGVIMMADASYQGVDFLDRTGAQATSFEVGNIAVGMTYSERAFLLAAIGHFFPRDDPRGQVIELARTDAGLRQENLISGLPRTTDVREADLNGDGTPDLVVCMYGNYLGRFSWFEGAPGNRFREHVLIDQPGAIRSAIHDFNDDGHPDVAVLVAQALETMYLFVNDGRGNFEKHPVFQRQPSWGHSGFDLADFNGDGRVDLLVTNGDNADFRTSPTRPYHGVRIYLNQGGLRFEEAAFFHLNGAYQAVARDFDGDGDLDIAAVSYFPDYEHSPRESFAYLENRGGLRFEASTFESSVAGRWVTLDTGDLDGDGDDDIVLGSLTGVPGPVPETLRTAWDTQGPSIMILYNRRFVPAPVSAPH